MDEVVQSAIYWLSSKLKSHNYGDNCRFNDDTATSRPRMENDIYIYNLPPDRLSHSAKSKRRVTSPARSGRAQPQGRPMHHIDVSDCAAAASRQPRQPRVGPRPQPGMMWRRLRAGEHSLRRQ